MQVQPNLLSQASVAKISYTTQTGTTLEQHYTWIRSSETNLHIQHNQCCIHLSVFTELALYITFARIIKYDQKWGAANAATDLQKFTQRQVIDNTPLTFPFLLLWHLNSQGNQILSLQSKLIRSMNMGFIFKRSQQGKKKKCYASALLNRKTPSDMLLQVTLYLSRQNHWANNSAWKPEQILVRRLFHGPMKSTKQGQAISNQAHHKFFSRHSRHNAKHKDPWFYVTF